MSGPGGLASLLASQPVVILDGGLGTELERRGVTINDSDLWSAGLLISQPGALAAVHRAFYAAGADVAATATYQASLEGFARAGVGTGDARALLVRGVELCDGARNAFWDAHRAGAVEEEEEEEGDDAEVGEREAGERESGGAHAARAAAGSMRSETQQRPQQPRKGADAPPRPPSLAAGRPRRGRRHRHRPLVAYSCGSYGAALADGSEYSGDYADRMSVEELMGFHRARLDPIKGHPAVDVLAFETIPCLKEAQAIVRLLDTEGYGLPAWIGFSCRDTQRTNHGERLAGDCMRLAAGCRSVAAVGVNCVDPHHAAPLLRSAGEALLAACASREPPVLICYPNSGEGWDKQMRCWVEAPGVSEPAPFAAAAREWVAAGARMVGGCCRTTPEHIAELRRQLL